MPGANRRALASRTFLATGALVLVGWSGGAAGQNLTITPSGEEASPVKIELIDNSRLGCGQGVGLWTPATGGTQCPFDTATRGMQVRAVDEIGKGSIETYATIARTTSGAFTPDELLASPDERADETTNFMLVGLKGSALDNRLKLTAEFARTERVVEALLNQDWALADWSRRSGTSASLKLDATLADRPGLKWSLSGEYRSVSGDYSVGRAPDLLRYFALPGSRLALTSKARVGDLAISAGLEEIRNPFGTSSSRKAGIDYQGISLALRSRESRAQPLDGISLIDSETRTTAAYLDVDSQTLADWLLPDSGPLPAFVPATISMSYRTGQTDSRYEATTERYRRSSLEIEGDWETPLGETSIGYWRDSRDGLSLGARSMVNETMQVSHSVRSGHWRFGADASLSRSRGDGENAYSDRSLSFGQSVAYSAPNGPEFRLQMGQDLGRMRMRDDSYASADSYSSITASLDLSRYLQNRFERPDLKLTLDYRKALERSQEEMNMFDELVERWSDSYRREGFLMSFAMKL